MKTVAIVGSHPGTRQLAPYSNPDVDIWVFNSAPIEEWCERVTAVFEIHQPEEYGASMNEASSDYGKWLLNQTQAVVYMQNADPRIPMAKEYPLQDIFRLGENLFRGQEQVRYFTSSPAYAIAMAILQGYERIEVYGIEMETNSEYLYQRDCVALWLGIAAGRGIQIMIPEGCSMLNAPLYGYEDDKSVITREELDERAKALSMRMADSYKAIERKRGVLDAIAVEMEEAKKSGRPYEEIGKTIGKKYVDATNDYEGEIGKYGFLQGQLAEIARLATKLEKLMIARGDAQTVFAFNTNKLRAQ